jgi:hypothetical protein
MNPERRQSGPPGRGDLIPERNSLEIERQPPRIGTIPSLLPIKSRFPEVSNSGYEPD